MKFLFTLKRVVRSISPKSKFSENEMCLHKTEGSKKPPNLETVKSLYYSDKIAFPKARNFARISEGETRNMAKAYLGRL